MRTVLERLRKIETNQKCFAKSNVFEDSNQGEKSVSLRITDGKQITRVQVDGCLITGNESKRCDYIAYHPQQDAILLIELKSSKIEREAIYAQFLGCLTFLKNNADKGKYSKSPCKCILICKKPRRGDTKMQNLNKMLKNQGLRFGFFYDNTIVKKSIKDLF